MILLDTNVLIYAFDTNSPMHSWAKGILLSSLLGDGAAINPVILAEYLVGESKPDSAVSLIENLGITFLDPPSLAAPLCAKAYARFLENRSRQSLPPAPKIPLPDFFIGAHASVLKLPIATADTARYKTYFPELQLITPTT